MFHKLLVITIFAVFIPACAGNLPVTEPPAAAPTQNTAAPTNQPPSEPLNNEYLPQPGDENFSRGEVFIDNSDLLIMESFPVQIALVFEGNLPTPCNHLRVIANPPDDENRIQVEAYSVINPAETCIQVLEPFQANVMLGSFPTGHYSLWLNGEMVGEFDS